MIASIVECDVVLFDMDGTLVDSTAIVERHWAQWATRHGIGLAEILAVAHGRPTLDTMRLVAPHLATKEEAEGLDAAEACDTAGLRAIEGARELLVSLPRTHWAVVTSADRDLAVARLTTSGLPVPDVIVTPADVARGKPDPAPFVLAAQKLSTTADRSVVLEDTPVGIQAGRAAGATVIGVTTTFKTLDHCHYTVANLRAVRARPGRERQIRLEVAASTRAIARQHSDSRNRFGFQKE